MKTKYVFRGAIQSMALVTSVLFGATTAHAQNPVPEGMTLVKTESGCQIYKITPAQATANAKLTSKWEGQCVNGLAQGLGNLATTYEVGAYKSELITRQRVHLGIPFGYGTNTFDTGTGGLNSRFLTWIFTFKNQQLGFRGLGLAGDPTLLNEDKVSLPTETLSAVRDVGTLNTPTHSLQFRKMHCAQLAKSVPQFQNCTYSQTDAEVYAFLNLLKTGGTTQERMAQAKYDVCPNPKTFDGCAEFAYQLAAPTRKEIIAFIEANRAEVEETIRAMKAVK